MEKLAYYINKKIVYVFVEYKSNKHLYLRIKKQQIFCTVPYHTPDDVIKLFVNKHIESFASHLEQSKKELYYSLDTDFLVFKNKKYFFVRLAGFHSNSVEIYQNRMYVKTLTSSNYAVKKAILIFLESSLNDYLKIRIPYWEKQLNLETHSFVISNKKSIWGQNLVGKNSLIFSIKLIHYSPLIIDYLIVHELTHSIYPNHSPHYWKVVQKLIPNYLVLKKELNSKKKFDKS